jgi:hypothetical protein
MYLSIVRGKVQPGKAEEFAQKWKDFYGSRLREMPEFQQGYYAADRATDSELGGGAMEREARRDTVAPGQAGILCPDQ